MLRRVRDYLMALAAVLAACLLYAQTVARLVDPGRKTANRETQTLDFAPDRPNPFEHLFQAGDWELEKPKVLMTSQGTLLFQDYRPTDKGGLVIRPCTLILYAVEDSDDVNQSARPIVVRANDGAELQFDSDVVISRGQFGRLTGGRILGDIRISSPESVPGAGDALELTTRNLQLERLKAWTPHEVKFRYGSSYGSGQDLVLMLAPGDGAVGGKLPALGGVESVQLTQVHEIHLEQQRASVLPGEAADRPPSQPQAPVKITCEGPLKFDVNRRMATFDDNVVLRRLLPEGQEDRLQCEQLALFLSNGDEPKEAMQSGKKQDLAGGSIERVVAMGKPVVLDVPSQNAHTKAERIEYNLKTRQVLLKAKAGASILLRRGGDQFVAPELAYEMVEGKQLGKLWAPGPGILTSTTGEGDDRKQFTASWKREIRIRPDEAFQLISLSDGAKIEVQQQGTFAADDIHFWVTETPTSRSDPKTPASNIVPDRLLATGHVQANSPQLSAETERLEVWFTQSPQTLPAASPEPPQELSLAPATGEALRQPIVRIQQPPNGREKPTDSSEPVQHFHLSGQTVRLEVEQSAKQMKLLGVNVVGPKVRILETNPPPGVLPIGMTGTRLDVEGGLDVNSVITVTGSEQVPATISARGMVLRSQTMKLSRRDNRVTIAQAGDMVLPVEEDFNGQKFDEPQQLKIVWDGSLVFDGAVAKFRRNVKVLGATYSAVTEELQAVLTSHIDFAQPKQAGKKPEIQKLVMVGGAAFENRTFNEEGRQQSVERMTAKSLEINRVSGALSGDGPGWLSRVQVGSPQLQTSPMETSPSQSSDEEGLTYLRVDFAKELRGNINNRQVQFSDQVQVVTGPVMHWDGTVDPIQRDVFGNTGFLLTCDQLEIAEFRPPGARKGALEMTALGSARVEGREFDAWASRLTYAAAKQQLVLEGDGRNDAMIKHQGKNEVRARKFVYWQQTGGVQIQDASSINIGPTAQGNPTSRPPSPRDFGQPR